MIGKAVSGLVGLGLIGGAGTVIYGNNGDATVKISDKATGKVETVRIESGDGQGFSCPAGTSEKLDPLVVRAGRIKLTLRGVRRVERQMLREYPSGRAPDRVVVRYNALRRRDDRLVNAYNIAVASHNTILRRDCTPSD